LVHRGRATRDSVARGRRVGLALILAVLPVLTACKVVPIAADRAARERMAGDLRRRPLCRHRLGRPGRALLDEVRRARFPDLAVAIDQDLDAAGAREGRRAGDGSPWTFVARGAGRGHRRRTRAARAGRVTVATHRWPAGRSRDVQIQVGPVVSGSTLRDSLPFVTFNDFSNQIAYRRGRRGDVAPGRSPRPTPVAQGLKVGDRVAVRRRLRPVEGRRSDPAHAHC
jgi:hypothetical protein